VRAAIAILLAAASLAPAADRIVVVYDDDGDGRFAHGWGYSAYVEYRGRRVLFDAGPNAEALAKNARLLGLDLAKLDAVVISHSDPDHYGGLAAAVSANPGVKVFVPDEDVGPFSTSLMNRLWRSLQGALPGQHPVDAPANANYVRGLREVVPGMRLRDFSFSRGHEQVLLIDVPGGVAMLTGCAHPGIAKLATGEGARVRLAAGGFHLVDSSPDDIGRIVKQLENAGIEGVCPGHCTGRLATERLRQTFQGNCTLSVVGTSIPLVTRH
jgi:7,8-dihydropterin-6-yl-methyl-4-(beta-D-ribofuranosyl)aminobenzene 5'-phosphate synthase